MTTLMKLTALLLFMIPLTLRAQNTGWADDPPALATLVEFARNESEPDPVFEIPANTALQPKNKSRPDV